MAAAAAALTVMATGCSARLDEQPPATTSVTTAARAPALVGEDGFAWAPFGPADADNAEIWYRHLEQRDCYNLYAAGLRMQGDPLVLALAAVCSAVDGDASQWQVAKQHAGQPRTNEPGCLAVAGEELLAAALVWHESHPGRTPFVSEPGPGDPVACKFEITRVGLADVREGASDLPQGPVTGNTKIVIAGEGLSEVFAVTVGGQPVERFEQEQSGFVVAYTPAADEPGPVDVAVRNRAGQALAPLAFMYLAVPDHAPASPQPSEPPAPAAPAPEPGQGEADQTEAAPGHADTAPDSAEAMPGLADVTPGQAAQDLTEAAPGLTDAERAPALGESD